jgi:hypothetical protein
MKALGTQKSFSFVPPSYEVGGTNSGQIRSNPGLSVGSFPELVERVAQLAFFNPEYALFFRGQSMDYKNVRGNTSIKPSIFRPDFESGPPPSQFILERRYQILREAEKLIIETFDTHDLRGRQRVLRARILRWAIIQHYEICATPLLDVTHSLRVAASFATQDASATDPVVLVLVAPAFGGTVSASSEQGIQTVRLSSICPPAARRPFFQEGHLLGEYPELTSFDEKKNYAHFEVDFGLRLLAKFHLDSGTFWDDPNYSPIPKEALYPNNRDPFYKKAEQIKNSLPSQ